MPLLQHLEQILQDRPAVLPPLDVMRRRTLELKLAGLLLHDQRDNLVVTGLLLILVQFGPPEAVILGRGDVDRLRIVRVEGEGGLLGRAEHQVQIIGKPGNADQAAVGLVGRPEACGKGIVEAWGAAAIGDSIGIRLLIAAAPHGMDALAKIEVAPIQAIAKVPGGGDRLPVGKLAHARQFRLGLAERSAVAQPADFIAVPIVPAF